jgi:hypothetical protein
MDPFIDNDFLTNDDKFYNFLPSEPQTQINTYTKIWSLIGVSMKSKRDVIRNIETVIMDTTSTKMDVLKHPNIWKHIKNSDFGRIFKLPEYSEDINNDIVNIILPWLGNWDYVNYQTQSGVYIDYMYDIVLIYNPTITFPNTNNNENNENDDRIFYFDSLVE